MNEKKLKEIINLGYNQWQEDGDNEVVWEQNVKEIISILSEDLDKTIDFLNDCTEKEFYYVSQIFEELDEKFKFQKLIDCVEKNLSRISESKIVEKIKYELDIMKKIK